MNESRIHQVFEVSVLLKGAHALIETIGGIALFFIANETVVNLVRMATQHELTEDPRDFIATHAMRLAEGFSVDSQRFYAFYLLSHGVVKLGLVIGLLRNKLWAYPASMVVLGLFILYQLYRYSQHGGVGLIVLTVFDLLVAWLVWHEYRLLRRIGTGRGAG